MFKCQSCSNTTKHNEPQTKCVTEWYEDKNIKKEISICTKCAGINWVPPTVADN